ncbi:hypothetical protein [Clostridium chromiireducens]|nr:hypothetical protein [Clostridium chromiireducens]
MSMYLKISHWIQLQGRAIGEEDERKEMTALLSTLKRWKEA